MIIITEYAIHLHDVVIIGGGLTGLRAAIEVAKGGYNAAVISKVHPLRSHSVAAQGGINAALGNAEGAEDDSWERHAFDTVKGSDYLADQDAVEILCKEAPRAVFELEHMGTVFSRMEDGRIAQRPFGGAGLPRTCYAADRTGHNLLHTLYEQTIDCGLKIYEEYFVTSLVVDSGKCIGCTALNIVEGNLHGFVSNAVLIATGGYGRIYAHSTNALINTGDGATLAYRAGVPLKDIEFIQFHPTTLYGTNILITEGARGEGGLLYNNRAERFMKDYAPKAMELAPRDIVARAIQTELNSGRGFENKYVHLDLTHLGEEKINKHLPGIRQIAIDFAGVDPIEEPIPVQPGQHYSMGGVDANKECATPLPGLYAAGECSCISVHGANRLGGNSLLETIVFGRVAGASIARGIKGSQPHTAPLENVKGALNKEKERIQNLLSREKGEAMADIMLELKTTMFKHFGIFRHESEMKEGVKRIDELKKRFSRIYIGNKSNVFNQALLALLELEGMLLISEAVAVGSLNRTESRGSHFRVDYPKRDDKNFLKHTLAYLRNGGAELEYSSVSLGKFPVKEREY